MAEYITDVIDTYDLTAFVRELVDGDLPFENLFPALQTEDIEYEIAQIDLSDAGEVARYRSWDTPAPIGNRPGVTVIKGEIPPLAWGYPLKEKQLRLLENLRAGLAERTNQTVVDTIYNDAARAARSVQNRLTIAHGSIMQTGGVELTELGGVAAGNELVAQFAVPGAHLNVAPAGDLWSVHATAEPVADLKAWETTYRSNNGGRNPDAWLVSSEVMADLALNEQIRTLAGGTSGVTPGVIGNLQVTQVLQAAGVNAPVVVALDIERPQLDDSTAARVVDDRAVIGVRAGIGATVYTRPPAEGSLVRAGAQQLAQDDPGIIAYVTGGIDPAWAKTTAEGLALPVLRDPNGLFVAAV